MHVQRIPVEVLFQSMLGSTSSRITSKQRSSEKNRKLATQVVNIINSAKLSAIQGKVVHTSTLP